MTTSTRKQQILTLLEEPITYNELSDALDLSVSACRNHINELQNGGFGIGYNTTDSGAKQWYLRAEQKEHPTNPDVPTGELRSKASVTKEAKKTVHGLIQWLQDDLNGRAPAEPENGLTVRESHQDMVCHRSDDHIGATYHDEYGNDTFSAEIGIERVRAVADRVFSLKERQEAAGVDFDTLHMVLGGDHVHGTGIHDDQPWETELPVPKQIYTASDIYMEFGRLSRHPNTPHYGAQHVDWTPYCVPGSIEELSTLHVEDYLEATREPRGLLDGGRDPSERAMRKLTENIKDPSDSNTASMPGTSSHHKRSRDRRVPIQLKRRDYS